MNKKPWCYNCVINMVLIVQSMVWRKKKTFKAIKLYDPAPPRIYHGLESSKYEGVIVAVLTLQETLVFSADLPFNFMCVNKKSSKIMP